MTPDKYVTVGAGLRKWLIPAAKILRSEEPERQEEEMKEGGISAASGRPGSRLSKSSRVSPSPAGKLF